MDIELNNTGIKQANIISDELSGITFDLVFSSPLKRAYKTAQIISNSEIIIDKRIVERSNGQLEGRYKKEFKEFNFNTIEENEYSIEPVSIFRNRINNFLDEITSKYPDKNVLIVTHAGVSIYIDCYFNGDTKDGNYGNLKLNNCEIQIYNKKTQ